MVDIHCHGCGGFISNPAPISYRLPSSRALPAAPHSSLCTCTPPIVYGPPQGYLSSPGRSEEHTSELQSQSNLVCRLLLEKKKKKNKEKQQKVKPSIPTGELE